MAFWGGGGQLDVSEEVLAREAAVEEIDLLKGPPSPSIDSSIARDYDSVTVPAGGFARHVIGAKMGTSIFLLARSSFSGRASRNELTSVFNVQQIPQRSSV